MLQRSYLEVFRSRPSVHSDVKYLGTARARLGVATEGLGSSFMFYGTAGAAWERVNQTTVASSGGACDVCTIHHDTS